MDFKKLFNIKKLKNNLGKLKGKNIITNLVILILVGILLVILSNTLKDYSTSKVNNNLDKKNNNISMDKSESKDANSNNDKKSAYSNEELEIEKKLKDTLENIQGVGMVKVMVYLKGGEEQVPAININDSTSLTEEKDTDGGTRKITQNNDGRTIVMMNTENGTKPFIVKKYKPNITGICVVAEGAEDNFVKLQIHKAVINLFDLKENQVNVYPMKK